MTLWKTWETLGMEGPWSPLETTLSRECWAAPPRHLIGPSGLDA